MTRYYFHIRKGTELIHDPEGIDFVDTKAAFQEAINAAREIVAERILKGEPFDGEGFEVVDHQGNPAFTLTFRSIVDAHPAR